MLAVLQEQLWRNASERRHLAGCRSLHMSGGGRYHKQHVTSIDVPTHNPRFPIPILLWKIQWDSENVNVGKRLCQPTTPIFKVGPIYTHTRRGKYSSICIYLELNETRERNRKVKNVHWRLKPTPTCGAMLESRNVSFISSYCYEIRTRINQGDCVMGA